MSTNPITYRVAAVTDAAGKYNPDAPLDGNEDNMYIADDLTNGTETPRTDLVLEMSECGCLLVVADGMGGMNAGEVASAIAIDTVRKYFTPGRVNPFVASDASERRRYMEHVVVEADARIKADAEADPSRQGMGSTIIMAWIVGNDVTVTWCGDSRAYRYNKLNGIEPLSTDHSYVQQLVEQGVITYEDTFDHPQGNIIVRSLGDPKGEARPESRDYKLSDGDIVLLCSDGLSGVLRDKVTFDRNGVPYAGDNIEDVIAEHSESMADCAAALMSAAKDADWYDNVTVLLCQITGGAGEPVLREPAVKPPHYNKPQAQQPAVQQPAAPAMPAVGDSVARPGVVNPVQRPQVSNSGFNLMAIIIAAALTLSVIGVGGWYFFFKDKNATEQQELTDGNSATVRNGLSNGTVNGGMGGSLSGNAGRDEAAEEKPEPGGRHNGASALETARNRCIKAVSTVTDERLDGYKKVIVKEIREADITNPKVMANINEMYTDLVERAQLMSVVDQLKQMADEDQAKGLDSFMVLLTRTEPMSHSLRQATADRIAAASREITGGH